MKKKIAWLILSCLIVVTLVLVSCGPAEEEEEEEGQTVVGEVTELEEEEEEEEEEEVVDTSGPQYGGVSAIVLTADILGFDEAFIPHTYVYTMHLTNEELLEGDWVKGPAGTGEADYILGGINSMDLKTGGLADGWEIPELGTMIFHIREGVHWHDKPPVNGRELTVDDVVFSLERMTTSPRAYIKTAYPTLAATTEITYDDSARIVTIKVPIDQWANCATLYPDYVEIVPRDAVEEFGHINDWRNSYGTGPFILTDYVSNASATLVRNPNYWKKDPCGPGMGNQLPYLDGIKMLIITDLSTRLAAMRTGKIEGAGFEYEDAWPIIEANPEIEYITYIHDSCYSMGMRTDDPESPFSDIRVRQALMLATDFDQIVDDFYGGKAEKLVWPISPTKEYANAYISLEELPANVRRLYEYDPVEAKQLLTAAGYPTGFSTSIICYNTPTQIDYLSQIQAMWAEVDIELEIDAKDYAVWRGRMGTRTFGPTDLFYAWDSGIGTFMKMINYRGSSQYNQSYVDDPVVEDAWTEMQMYVGIDEAKMMEINAELMPYLLEQAYVIPKPNPLLVVMWWPWVENFNGAFNCGYYNWPSYLKYVWHDLTLKEQMTGRR